MTKQRSLYCRADLETAVALATGLSQEQAVAAVGAVITGIVVALYDGDSVFLDGVGRLDCYSKPPRKYKVTHGGTAVMMDHRIDWQSQVNIQGQAVDYRYVTMPRRVGVRFRADMALSELLSPEWAKWRRERNRARYLAKRGEPARVGEPAAAGACPATVGDEGPPGWLAVKRQAKPYGKG